MIGLSIGLAVALGVFLHYRNPAPEQPTPEATVAPASAQASETAPPAPAPAGAPPEYDFYKMLPEQEVEVPKDAARARQSGGARRRARRRDVAGGLVQGHGPGGEDAGAARAARHRVPHPAVHACRTRPGIACASGRSAPSRSSTRCAPSWPRRKSKRRPCRPRSWRPRRPDIEKDGSKRRTSCPRMPPSLTRPFQVLCGPRFDKPASTAQHQLIARLSSVAQSPATTSGAFKLSGAILRRAVLCRCR